jgi:hypothetical protein
MFNKMPAKDRILTIWQKNGRKSSLEEWERGRKGEWEKKNFNFSHSPSHPFSHSYLKV